MDSQTSGQAATQHMLQDFEKHFALNVLFWKRKKNTLSNKVGLSDIPQLLLEEEWGGSTVSCFFFFPQVHSKIAIKITLLLL